MPLSIEREAAITNQPEDIVRANRAAHAAIWAWEAEQLTALTPREGADQVVDYGSPEWLALAPNDPRRASAMIRAARAWRQRQAELAEQIVKDTEQAMAEGAADRAAYFAEWQAQEQEEWSLIVQDVRSWANHPTAVERAEQRSAEQRAQARPVAASAGWPPVAIPGRPGWRRHLVSGRQVDLCGGLEVAA